MLLADASCYYQEYPFLSSSHIAATSVAILIKYVVIITVLVLSVITVCGLAGVRANAFGFMVQIRVSPSFCLNSLNPIALLE